MVLRKTKNLKIKVIVLLIVFLFGLSVFSSKDISPNTPIAVVNGDTIIYKHIRWREDDALFGFKMRKGREPSEKELSEFIMEEEIGALKRQIQKLIYAQEIKKLNILVTEEEIKHRIDSLFSNAHIDSLEITLANRRISSIIKALKEFVRNPKRKKEIYDENLSEYMQYSEWNYMLEKHKDSLESLIKTLEEGMPQTIEDLKKSFYRTAKSDIIYEKFKKLITKDISITEKEIKEYYDKYKKAMLVKEEPKEKSVASYEEVRGKLREELLKRKREEKIKKWWDERYKKGNIKILFDKYKGVLTEITQPDTAASVEENKSF